MDNPLNLHILQEEVFPSPSLQQEQTGTIDRKTYHAMYRQSITDPENFWQQQAASLTWEVPFHTVRNTSFTGDVAIKWFEGGHLNVSSNCIDRHLLDKGEQAAIIWEGDNPEEGRIITYNMLHQSVCKLANVLKNLGVKKGDRVIIYMPMIPEAAFAMLACARIGAVHSVVFGGFSAEALKGRIEDSGASLIITADEGMRGGKAIPLKVNVDEAIKACNIAVKNVLVVKRTGGEIAWIEGRDIAYHAAMEDASPLCEPEIMESEDPLFILYTSGSTGKPKGVLHTSAGYLLYASLTHKYVFDYRDGEIYWCTADIGWVTGHSYIVYGPLCNGATTLMFEGVPHYPDFSRFWQVVDKHKVNIFYTAPTAIRALMREGEGHVTNTSRASLRVLGSVGEPINPEAWRWYHGVVGNGNCPIVDTWWQTETGGIMIAPLPYATDLKPGSATLPFFGVQPVIVNESGEIQEGAAEGYLALKDSWPGQMRTLYGDHQRFIETYFSTFSGLYFSGDGCRRDEDGYYWITGRVDDVINISGHRLGTAEIESALVAHRMVAEAAVVGYPHPIKGQGIYAFVMLNSSVEISEKLVRELLLWVRKQIGPIATPDLLQCVSGLPKTRSGKIMRRILRKIAENKYDNLGDINTLTNPEVLETIIAERLNKE